MEYFQFVKGFWPRVKQLFIDQFLFITCFTTGCFMMSFCDGYLKKRLIIFWKFVLRDFWRCSFFEKISIAKQFRTFEVQRNFRIFSIFKIASNLLIFENVKIKSTSTSLSYVSSLYWIFIYVIQLCICPNY